MPVQYVSYYDVDIADVDAIVVGAGLAGSVMARELAERMEKRVLVIEKRDVVAGCLYDFTNELGIRVNKYGPHVFHTDSERVIEYISRFATLREYHHSVQAFYEGRYVPIPFNEHSIAEVFDKRTASAMIHALHIQYGTGSQVALRDLARSGISVLEDLAHYVYDHIVKDYSYHQWGLSPDDVDKQILSRFPVRVSQNDIYFTDMYQGVPVDGYTSMIERMLSHPKIQVALNTEAESVFDLVFESDDTYAPLTGIRLKDTPFMGPIVFSGPIDELFLQRFGRLPYRTVDFEFIDIEEVPTEDGFVLPCGCINHTMSSSFTRTTECKRLTGQKAAGTTLVREYPHTYEDPRTETPFFPQLTDENKVQHQVYLDLVKHLPNFYVIGRLAEYSYFDMDQMVAHALALSDAMYLAS